MRICVVCMCSVWLRQKFIGIKPMMDILLSYVCMDAGASIMSTYVCACSVCAHALTIFTDNDTQTI